MRRIAQGLVVLILLGACAHAQTIIGESTYGDNFLHTPPPPPKPPVRPAADRAKADVPPTGSIPAPPDTRR